MSETVDVQSLTPRQQQAANARKAFAAKFSSSEEKAEYFRQIGAKSNASRATLRADDVQTLHRVYALLGEIVSRLPNPGVDEQSASAA